MKVENHKYVDSYWVEELPNGVIHLLINCKKRWLDYHAYNDYEFLIYECEVEFNEGITNEVIKIPEFLPKSDSVFYIRTVLQEKDQISFYYIPHGYFDSKNKKILIE